MASDALKLMAQIVISYPSMSELITDQLVEEIKKVYFVIPGRRCDLREHGF
jgi:hypothetical protein